MCFYKYQLPWCQPLRVHFMWTLYFDDQSIGFLFSSLMLLLTSSEVRVGEESFFMVCCIWNTNTDFNKNFRSQRHVSLFSLWCLSVKPSIAATPPESHWIWLYIPCCCCCCCCIASVVSDSVQPHRWQPKCNSSMSISRALKIFKSFQLIILLPSFVSNMKEKALGINPFMQSYRHFRKPQTVNIPKKKDMICWITNSRNDIFALVNEYLSRVYSKIGRCIYYI